MEFLRSKFPAGPPKLTDSDREVWVEVGFQKCIKYLDSLVKRQERQNGPAQPFVPDD